ncbi:hypothetical protein [Mesorhizobium sp. M0185]|uniref:hypothetical protein n=1 Tax=unclassified Mesorhizobium TaxID=325217 RepID=UPI00333635AA
MDDHDREQERIQRCRNEVRIDKSDERPRGGDLDLSIEDGKKIMAALQTVVAT